MLGNTSGPFWTACNHPQLTVWILKLQTCTVFVLVIWVHWMNSYFSAEVFKIPVHLVDIQISESAKEHQTEYC